MKRLRGAPDVAVDYTEGVIEQLLVSAWQVVLAAPGSRGVKVIAAPLSTAAESMVPVIELQALLAGPGKPEKLLTTATIAWFM